MALKGHSTYTMGGLASQNDPKYHVEDILVRFKYQPKLDDFDVSNDIVDAYPRISCKITAKYKKCWAYITYKVRIPKIIDDIIEIMVLSKDEMLCEYGKAARFDIARVTDSLIRLKDKILHNCTFEKFYTKEPDTEIWNQFLGTLPENDCSWFTATWLITDCYLYRRISSFFKRTATLSKYDCFKKIKYESVYHNRFAMHAITYITRYLAKNYDIFSRLIKLQLWGNRYDVCDAMDVTGETELTEMSLHGAKLLVDHSLQIWKMLQKFDRKTIRYVDIVVDNAGLELFTDFIFAEYLIDKNYANRVRFHMKAIPWFVSDANAGDFHYLLKFMCQETDICVRKLGEKLKKYLKEGVFILEETEYFWTSPFEYYRMKEICPCLYVKLSQAIMVIFKGDYNYRKLCTDTFCEPTMPLRDCLRGFLPTNIVALRAIKSEILCGMPPCVVPALTHGDPTWMLRGEYGVLQLVEKFS